MDIKEANVQDRVRENTPEEENQQIDQKAVEQIEKFQGPSHEIISHRLQELENEWDVERYLEVNAASLGLLGLVMGSFFGRKWFVLTGVVTGFMLQHGMQGWCPPLPLIRAFGVRTRKEIEEEKYALKVLRGDFDKISASSEPRQILEGLRD